MISRTTSQSMVRTAQHNLQASMSALAKLQDQASSRKAITRPSDDPTATAQALQVRAEQRATSQYSRNIADGTGWLTTVDSALSATTGILNRVRDLTVRGANEGAMSPTALEAIAVELDSMRAELLKQANTTYLGRSVFAGNSDASVAFNPDYSYTGAAGSTVERRIDANNTVRVDGDGAAVFGVGAGSVFALVDAIAADLRSGVNVGPRLQEIDDRLTAMLGEQAAAGTRHAQMQSAEESNMEQSVALEAQRSGVEDVDLAGIILDLKLQEVAYQSALAVTARALQPSLMDFLR
ncbi:flagellar hook-associated protein FlgL [Cryobacterium sp. BB736]|uniref:flagellar hook-associated protein FlgL n=1 Tax=Cryobacterium sp. BB736 TaxID=2746963 RepID=UPI0018759B8A|nr:flagellar hook-associated protein FlgL [Cryobacterium sp. BB736]